MHEYNNLKVSNAQLEKKSLDFYFSIKNNIYQRVMSCLEAPIML